ncbi:MAG: DNA translocase FtsK 4TM domain-containing protein [Deltaproteobacteria bacterium]|nr:DNA translocase FtsK 4TM domain-containing protein [Deltaproteobacteria bacterium]
MMDRQKGKKKNILFSIPWRMSPSLFVVSALTLYYLMTMGSWSPIDPSPFSVTVPPPAPQNLGGTYGAWLSGTMIYYLGWLAWLLPLPFIGLLILQFKTNSGLLSQSLLFIRAVFFYSICFILLSILSDRFLPYAQMSDIPIPLSGALGELTVRMLKVRIGEGGLSLLIAILPLWILSVILPVSGAIKYLYTWRQHA